MGLKGTYCQAFDLLNMVQNRDSWRAVMNTVFLQIKSTWCTIVKKILHQGDFICKIIEGCTFNKTQK